MAPEPMLKHSAHCQVHGQCLKYVRFSNSAPLWVRMSAISPLRKPCSSPLP